jgi:hypothetical protein
MLQPTDVRPIQATRAAHLSVKTQHRRVSMRSRAPSSNPRKASAVESHLSTLAPFIFIANLCSPILLDHSLVGPKLGLPPIFRLFRSGSASHGMPTQTRAAAAFRRGFLAPRSRASLHAQSRPAPSSRLHDDGTSSSSDEGGPRVYSAPRPASTLPPGKTPLIGRAGRAIFGCGISLAGASLFLCRILPPCRRTGLTKR